MAVVRNLMVRAGADFSAMRKEMDRARTNVTGFRKKVDSEMDKMNTGIAGKMKKLGGILAAAFAVKQVVRWGKEAAAAYNEAAVANAQLERVMRNTMRATKEQIQSIHNLAKAQERIGVVSTGVQISGSQELATYLSDARSLQTLLPTLNDMLAQQYGVDATANNAVQLATMIGKVMDGQLGALSRYGYSWTEAQERVLKFGNELERANMLAEVIGQSVGGMNRALADTPTGRLTQLKNTFGAIKEEIGKGLMTLLTAILPLIEAIANALLKAAQAATQFVSVLFGVTYEAEGVTGSIGDQVDYLDDLEDGYDGVTDSVRKARRELASFDRLNLLGSTNGGGSGGGLFPGGGGGIEWPSPTFRPTVDWDGMLSEIRRIPSRITINFEMRPPDAGAGAVATAVISTVNEMSAQVRLRVAGMWSEMDGLTVNGLSGQLARWGQFAGNLTGSLVPGMTTGVIFNWRAMWDALRGSTDVTAPVIESRWSAMLDHMRGYLTNSVPAIQADWDKINDTVLSTQQPLNLVRTHWGLTLQDMLARLLTAEPEFKFSWGAIGEAVGSLANPLEQTRSAWATTLQDMYATVQQKVSGIVSETQRAVSALNSLRAASGQQIQSPAATPAPTQQPVFKNVVQEAQKKADLDKALEDMFWSRAAAKTAAQNRPAPTAPTSNRPAWVDQTPVLGDIYRGLDWVQQTTEPLAKGAMQFAGGGGAAGIAGKGAQWLQQMLRGAIPGFATGGIVSGPTLAMVGEYAGAINNPEVIAPLSDLESMIDTGEQVDVLRQILGAIQQGQSVTVTISEDEVAGAAIRGHNKRARRLGKSELNL